MLVRRSRPRAPRPWTLGILAAALALPPAAAAQHDAGHAHPPSAAPVSDLGRLGRVEFPNSGAPAAQPAFQRGMALLHSFLFREAREAFREARRVDPGFAMAYWGELRSADDSAAADTVMRQFGPTAAARLARARTPRERDYLALAERYAVVPERAQGDTALTYRQLDDARALHQRYPDDDEARLLYALALVGARFAAASAPDGAERSLRMSVEAAGLIEEVFARRPDHPGAAHYLIHAYDDARLAPLGLRAARVYARIAPAAHHAVHMPSHIFYQFGMWDDVVAANERAWALSKASTAGRPVPAERWDYHALDWLHYAHLQRGERRRAAALADSARAALTPPRLATLPAGARAFYARLPVAWAAREPLEVGERDGPAPAVPSALVEGAWLAHARHAARRGDRAAVEAAERRLQAVVDSTRRAEPQRLAPGTPRVVHLVRALALQAAGQRDSALVLLRAAADTAERRPSLPLAEGPARSEAGTPRVMLGELLLDAGRPAEAVVAFDRALALSPGRSAALLGRARALARLGRGDEAARAYARLLDNWRRADPDLPALAEARRGAAARPAAVGAGEAAAAAGLP